MSDERALIESDIEKYLERHQNKELLRFTTVGSVDDGKSTLIGRLLHDTHGIYEDQLNAVKRASSQKGTEMDLSLLTDGLKAEREQGITIDVAYRYFSTENRKFIIADTPGHVQYTRNMATGASTANVAIILIDARLGVQQQSRRHAYIAWLLGIPHLLVAVNKMDLKGYEQGIFESIRETFAAFATKLGFTDVKFIPISALAGDNVVTPSTHMPWYSGGTLLEFLETVPIANDRNLTDFRYPVQYVLRPHLDYRGFAGEIASGVVTKGDTVMVMSSRKTSRIKAIDTFEGEVESAFAPMSVTLRLTDEIDVSRGDILVHPDNVPHAGRFFDAMLVWMSERPLDTAKSYYLKHSTQMVRAHVEAVRYQVDLEDLTETSAEGLELNDIGRVSIRCHRPIHFDAYRKNRKTGAFILVDSITNNTVAAGMILEPERGVSVRGGSEDRSTARSHVSPRERRERLRQGGATVWLTGLPGSGKSAIAYAVERQLFDRGRIAVVVDPADGIGDRGPQSASAPQHAAEVARRNTDAGLITIFAYASPSRAEREALIRAQSPESVLVVHVAPAGTAPPSSLSYEAPDAGPTVSLDDAGNPEPAAAAIVRLLEERGFFDD